MLGLQQARRILAPSSGIGIIDISVAREHVNRINMMLFQMERGGISAHGHFGVKKAHPRQLADGVRKPSISKIGVTLFIILTNMPQS